jgi:hypothetical protein
MSPTTPAPDPIETLSTITADQLRQRLQALDAERRAIVVLLRSVAARERAAARRTSTPAGPEEADDA